ncbi:uncharacterized protein LOC119461146 isoform X2 [Dermacentor silvarum]|uniref:uncharacterized protein LOC119461146 isoform X2 n=1 Tax=Dermacentor silvarum TaxID=543639 RepID=UPI002101C518|nr:uncharacterized protein LOC119461146 isoform X2 [Dermacentor silvarum]
MVWYPKIFAIKKKGTTGTELPFPSGRCSIGGDPTCDVQIRSAGSAHCILFIDTNKQAHVINVTSTKEVLRNDEHVPNQAFLSHGDIVTVGSRQFRFEWVSTQKKKGKQSSPAATGSQQRKGGPRESSTMEGDTGKESPVVQQAHGTPGVSTPTTSFFDQSHYKTPCIPTEVFVSPLSASNSSDAGRQTERPSRSRSAVAHGAARNGEATVHAKRLSWNDGLPNSPCEVSDFTSSRKLLKAKRQGPIATTFPTPTQGVSSPKGRDGCVIDLVAESSVNGQLYDSSSSTPLIDEPRMRAMRSRSSLASMGDTSAEHERSASLGRLSKSPVKRRQSSEITTEEKSPKLRRQNGYEDVQDTSSASHSDCNGQSVSGKSLGENSVEECKTHIKGLATPSAASGILVASTPVAGVISRNNRMKNGSARKSNKLLRQAQENRSVYSTPVLQNSWSTSSAATPELSFLSTRSSSRMTRRSFKGNESLDGLQTSNILDDTLGCEFMFKTPGSSFNLSATKELNSKGNGMVQDVSDSSAPNEPAQKSLVSTSQATDTSLLHTSGRRRSTAFTTMSEHNEVPELEIVGTSLSKRASLHSINTAVEKTFNMTGARSSRTPASKKVDAEVLEGGVFGTPNALNASRAKRTPASKKSDEEIAKQGAVATMQALNVSSTKLTPASKKAKEEEVPQKEIVCTSLSEHVSSGNVNVALENSLGYGNAPASMNVTAGVPESFSTPSNLSASRSKRTVASKANGKVTQSLNTGKSRRKPASCNVNDQDEAPEQELTGTLSSEHVTADVTDVAVEQTATRSVRSSRTPASRRMDADVPKLETVGMLSSSGAKRTPASKVTNEDLEQGRIDTLKSSKSAGAKQTSVPENANEKEEASAQISNVNAALEDSARSVRSTRSCRTVASRKVNVEVSAQETAEQPPQKKASRAKRTQASRKMNEECDTPGSLVEPLAENVVSSEKEPVQSPVKGRRKRAAAVKQENIPEQELKDEAVTLPPSSTSRRGRGKRALASLEEGVETQPSTVEDNVGTIQKKKGRQPKQVAPSVDVSEQNDAEELSKKVGISSKSTKSRRVASSKQEQNDEALEDNLCTDEATLAASLRRSKRKVAEVTATVEVTPKKTRGRRAKAVESVNVNEQGSAVKALKNEQPEEVAPAKRTRKRL